jgi:hypothetical protein
VANWHHALFFEQVRRLRSRPLVRPPDHPHTSSSIKKNTTTMTEKHTQLSELTHNNNTQHTAARTTALITIRCSTSHLFSAGVHRQDGSVTVIFSSKHC